MRAAVGSGPVEAVSEPDRSPATVGWRRPAWTLAALGVLVAVSAVVRLEGLRLPLWSDEGISLGIASHPVVDIPAVLRHDGSPPLYYVLLHGWMRWWGSSAASVRTLSLLVALAGVPIAFGVARSLFGRRAGWMAAVLAATSAYLGEHGSEARMYALVAVLGLVAAGALAQAFAFRRRRWLPLFVVSTALLVYTHTWGVFFVVGAAAAVIRCAVAARDRRRAWLDAALALAAVAALVSPWVPILVDQAAHTGAPWSRRPAAGAMGVALVSVLGGAWTALVALAALAPIARAVRREPRAPGHVAVTALALLVGAALAASWLASQVEPAWSARYFGILLGPLVVLVALGLARAGRAGVAGAVAMAVLGVAVTGNPLPKGNVEQVAAQLAGVVGPGDVVLSTQMEQVPLLHVELGPDLRYAVPDGEVGDPRVADWREAFERSQAAQPAAVLAPLVDDLRPGGHVVVVCPAPSTTPDDLRWYRLMDLHCDTARDALSRRRDLAPVLGPIPAPAAQAQPGVSVVAVVYERIGPR